MGKVNSLRMGQHEKTCEDFYAGIISESEFRLKCCNSGYDRDWIDDCVAAIEDAIRDDERF